MVGTLTWQRERNVSNPAQQQLGVHRSPVLVSFGKPKSSDKSCPPLGMSPGPGHYLLPDPLGTSWQRYPPPGKSFVRQPPQPGESRFVGLARGLDDSKGGKGTMDFFGG